MLHLINTITQKLHEGRRAAQKAIDLQYDLKTLLSAHKFCIAPAARVAEKAIPVLKNIGLTPSALCDNDQSKWGQSIQGIKVSAYEEWLSVNPDGVVVMASALHDSAITDQLKAKGQQRIISFPVMCHFLPEAFATREYTGLQESLFSPGVLDKVISLYNRLADETSQRVLLHKILFALTYEKNLLDQIKSKNNIYFDDEILALSTEELFVDAGAFNGDTLIAFLQTTNSQFQNYFAFEPDPLVFETLKLLALPYSSRIKCIHAGISDTTTELKFLKQGSLDSRFLQQGEYALDDVVLLNVVTLDEYFAGKNPPTYIKMDIEGFEREGLRGATQLIREHQPKLAVSCYHYPRDLWELPLMLAELQPQAQIYLRHYTREIDDTVCYCITR